MAELELVLGKTVAENRPCFVIAEIGQNHQGSIEIAEKLIDEACKAGVDCVKFQKTSLPDKFTKFALMKPYNSVNSWGSTYGEHKQYLEFSEEQFYHLQSYAKKRNVLFTATPKDIVSLHFLLRLDVPFIKIGSGDSDDALLLQEAAASGKPLVISTGMQDIDAVRQVYKSVKNFHNKFAILQCVSSYPTEVSDINLRVIQLYKKEFPDIIIGYSGHELGTNISVAAVAMGAKIIERHITLDKTQKGADHACSLLPDEFRTMIQSIREIELALGSPEKQFLPCENSCYEKLGKSLVAARKLHKGDTISKFDIKVKVSHPNGVPAKEYAKVIGAIVNVELEFDQPFTFQNLAWTQ